MSRSKNTLPGWLGFRFPMRQQDMANEKRTNLWCFAWMLSLFAAGAPRLIDVIPDWVGWPFAVLSLGVGLIFVRAYLKLLREADELLRQIQLEALATGFGTGLITGLTVMYLTPPGPVWGLVPMMAMVLAYVARVLWAARQAAKDEDQ